MNFRERLLANRRRRNYVLSKRKIEADAFDARNLVALTRKFAPANWVKVDEEDFSTTVTAYVTGVSPVTLIKGAVRAVESFRGSTFKRDFSNPVVKHIDVKGLYGVSLYTICFTCIDRDARIFVNILDDNTGCTVSLCQDTSPSA